MSQKDGPSISVRVDPTNPGQFFACCGLLELADRLWKDVEGWFEEDDCVFAIKSAEPQSGVRELIQRLNGAGICGELSPPLQQERNQLEDKRKQLKKEGKVLPKGEEKRRKELGTCDREGALFIGEPFRLRLDWWQEDTDDVPKTWAGSQQVLRIAKAALGKMDQAFETDSPFDYSCVMRPVEDRFNDGNMPARLKRRKNMASENDKVEPFYFDSRSGANALPLDIGFSPNELGMESKAFPSVELLALVGLQRCRPKPISPRVFEYFTWDSPLLSSVVPAAVCGLLSHIGGRGFRFQNAFRTDQKKHKGFLQATPIGGGVS